MSSSPICRKKTKCTNEDLDIKLVSYKNWSIENNELLEMGVNMLPSSEINENNLKEITSEESLKKGIDELNKDLQTSSELRYRVKKFAQMKKSANDLFTKLSDEIILMIMHFLPRRSLFECAQVCQRWRRIVYDESLWIRIDLSGRTVRSDTMGYILSRNPLILRMAQVDVQTPLFKELTLTTTDLAAKVEFLDLSMAVISSKDLALLLSKCKKIRKLSLEHCTTDEDVCRSISNNINLETLNLSLCYELNDIGLKYIIENCTSLQDLNVQWTRLNESAISVICKSINYGIKNLNLSGCGKNINDELVEILLMRCENLIELDLSDCVQLTDLTINSLMKYVPKLSTLSLSRCYRITPALYRVLKKPSLKVLNFFGVLHERQIQLLEMSSRVQINRFKFSTIARPTVGIRRTSIWGIRVRD
ncbi:S-phase kinase-associated protein 2 isoform X2 [Lycorma delicatula]|uniref:S-phase kinase-associated protein 2 isoform X2 n=1 Tax=Lycorma delicatula TaxID=130591 RepID=UPI003F5190B6